MVDAKDRTGRKDVIDDAVQFLRASEIVAEWLLDDNPTPCIVFSRRQAAALQLFDHHGEEARRNRQVERVIAACASQAVEFAKHASELIEGCRIVEVTHDEAKTL